MSDEVEFLLEDAFAGRVNRRQFLKQAFALGASGAVLSLGLAACKSNAASGGASKPLVGVDYFSLTHFRIPHDRQFFINEANKIGLRYVIQGANNDQTLQETQVDAMISQGIKALVIMPVNIDGAVALVERVKRNAKIPIISYNSIIPSTAIDYWAARNNFEVGDLQAKKLLVDRPDGGNFAVSSGPPGLDIAEQKTEGAMRVMRPQVATGKWKLVSQQFHDNWDPALSLAQIENALTKVHNNLQGVIANEDGLCLGALKALTEQHQDGKTWICGEDVFPEVAQNIVKGRINATAWTDLIAMGTAAADAAKALATGKIPASNDTFQVSGKTIPGMRIHSRLVTKENLLEFIKLTGWLKPSDVGLPG